MPRHGEWGAEQPDRTIIERALAVRCASRHPADYGSFRLTYGRLVFADDSEVPRDNLAA